MQRLHPQTHSQLTSVAKPVIPVGDYLIDSYLHGDVNECIVVTLHNKTDLQQYYASGKVGQMLLTSALIDHSPGTPWTISHGLRQVLDRPASFANQPLHFAMGFPDIITSPHDVFQHLFARLETGEADVVLGLFRVPSPQKYDMVRFHPAAAAAGSRHHSGRVSGIDIKPQSTPLEWTWACAVWNERFSRYLLQFTQTRDPQVAKSQTSAEPPAETYVGDILIAAMASGLTIDCLCFSNGKVLDIGTPDDLELARSSAIGEYFS